MLWFIAALISFALGMFYKRSKGNMFNRKFFDGEVAYIDPAKKEITVQYTVDGRIIQAAAKENYGDFSKIKCGQKVLVLTHREAPEVPMCVAYNTKSKDRSMGGSTRAAFIISAMCLFMGIVSLFK